MFRSYNANPLSWQCHSGWTSQCFSTSMTRLFRAGDDDNYVR
jgi:hypothetical protein